MTIQYVEWMYVPLSEFVHALEKIIEESYVKISTLVSTLYQQLPRKRDLSRYHLMVPTLETLWKIPMIPYNISMPCMRHLLCKIPKKKRKVQCYSRYLKQHMIYKLYSLYEQSSISLQLQKNQHS